MTSIRFPIPEETEEDRRKWLELAKKLRQGRVSKLPDTYGAAPIFGMKWNCEHDKRPDECDNPKCVAKYVHDE